MRVTNRMLTGQMTTGLDALRTRMADLETQVATGRRLQRPSDDPAATVNAMRLQTALRQLDGYQSHHADAQGWLAATEGALAQMGEGLARVRELVIQGSNDVLPADALAALAQEVQALRGSLLDQANGDHAGTALFAGFQTGLKPFADTVVPPAVRYSGDSGQMLRDVGPGTTVAVNIAGDRLLAAGDFFTLLEDLAADLMAGDTAAVRGRLTDLDAATDNVIALRTEVGVRMKRLEQLDLWYLDARMNFGTQLEQVEGVAFEEALMNLNQADVTYRATLQLSGRILPETLADFLR